MPLLGDPRHLEMVEHLHAIASVIRKPSAIVVISAHWEEPVISVTAHPRPRLIYDYYGFPPESYAFEYPAPGAPALAERLVAKLMQNGLDARLDVARGYDHGLYIPLLLMYPAADVPCVQVSLLAGLDPERHIRMGEAMAGLARENVLVLGSGFSFHNLPALLGRDESPDSGNEAFEGWLIDTCTNEELSPQERRNRLVDWESAPAARYCHPREEHLVPLHACYGVTGSACISHAELTIMGKKCSSYFW